MKNLYSTQNTKKQIYFYFLQIVLLFGAVFSANAQLRVPFTQRTSQYSPSRSVYNIKGDFAMVGNTNLTLQNYNDSDTNNNPMVYVDVDGDPNTLNSSSSNLSFSTENGALPSCSRIIYAGLYWTGRSSDSNPSNNIFTVTKTVPGGTQAINNDYTLGNNSAITNTAYTLSISRGGSINNRYPIYTFSNGTNNYVFSYTNGSGASMVTLSVNGGTPVNVPVTVSTSGSTATATLATSYTIVNGSVTISIKNLVRSTSTSLSTTDTQNTSFSNVNVSGTIPGNITVTKTYDKRVISLKGPQSSTYTQFTAAASDIYYPTTTDGYMYSAYAEVTDYVRNNGLGNYFAADIALVEGDGGGTGFYGGWSLVVVYENSKMKYRDVTIFDGHAYVAGSVTADFEIPVSGFNTVQSGPVNMKLGLMAGEGDRGISGDYFQIRNHTNTNWVTLNHSGNATDNFFNSSIVTGGNTRNPNLLNNTGLDISVFNIPNAGNAVMTNNQTSTRFRYGTTQDTYVIFAAVMSVDAYIPDVENILSTTAINNIPVSSPPYTVLPGQEMTFNVTIKNLGTEPINNYKLVIPIPFNATYVAGSAVGSIFFTPLPTPNTISFDPNLGATGSLVWDFGTLPLPADPNTLLGALSFKLRATTDCSILSNPNCSAPVGVNGSSSGIGGITGVSFNDKQFIKGYSQNGNCLGEPISQPLNVDINAANYVNTNCQNTPLVRNFNFCNSSTTVAVSQIAPNFPIGSLFYNQYPVTQSAIQYTASNPFPLVSGSTITYYAVPPNTSGCFFPFTISKCGVIDAVNDNYSNINCTTTGLIGNVISNDLLNNVPVPSNLVTFTLLTGSNPNISFDSSGNITVTSGIAAGTYTFTYKICENANLSNCDTATITINVTDTTAPVIASLPVPSTISCPATPSFATATATDTCGSATLSFVDVVTNGTCSGSYSVTRTWTATDASGNTSTASQTINVTDTTAPVIAALPAPSTISCPATPSFATATATDACGSTFTLTFNDVTTNGQCAGSYSVTRTWTATDACGNASTASQTINVTDTTAPVIAALPAPSTISCPATPSFATATATDACGSSFTLTFNDVTTNGQCAGSYSVTRTWTATDACGNASTASQTINVTDTTAPVIAALPAPSTISCPATPSFATATATDACGSTFTLTFNDVTTNGACAGSYSVTRTWTATDACGNASTASQTINVTDTTAPVIAALPAPSTISCPATPSFATATATDACGSTFTLTFNDVTTNGQCAGSYSVTRTWTATDSCGNASTASQTINVTDTTAPVIAALPAPSTISCPATPSFATATATDACGSTFTLTFNDVTTNGQCAGSYSVTRTWTATDSCGNASTASQTINVTDTTAPVIAALPAPSTISCPATPSFATATATDACGSTFTLTFNDVTTNGQCAGSYSVTRTWTATDACGNASTASQTINVTDTTAPVIAALPAPSTISCPATPSFATATATDACGSSFTLTFNDVTTNGQCAGSYSVTRTWTATDACGNASTASQTINVTDTTAPVIAALPAPSTISCPATPSFATATATDACGSTFTLTFNDVTTNGACAGSYSVTRTWTATDACGNASTASQTINVTDTTAPVIAALPAPSTISCPATPSFATATATDACGSTFTLTFNDVTTNGQCAGSYSVTRTWTATDSCGNASTASQTINVTDTTAPVIAALPAPSTISCPATPSFATATATDDCGSTFTLTFNDVTTNGACAGSYSVTRTWTATDACGNASTASQTINVTDTTAPVIAALPAPSTISCPATPSFATATATDACGSTFTLTFNDVTTNGQCAGSYSVTRTWTATDACGNASTASQTINVTDTTAPVIAALPAPSTISCPATPSFATATATDACGSSFTLTFNDVTTNGQCAGSYSVTRTWTATDACGNASTASQTINVTDTTAPVIAALPAPSTISCPATPSFATATATDACGSTFTLTFNDVTTNGACAGSYSVTRTWTATDACGNASTASQTINVTDTTAPVIAALPAPSTISCPATPSFATATATDACGSTFTLTFNDVTTNGQCAGSYSVTRTWTATDSCGNASTASQTINVTDTTAPVIAALPAPSTISCPATPSFATATATDDCGSTFTLTFNDVTTNGACAGSYSVTRTWTATDACGNASTASQTINVTDTTAPVIAALPAPSTISCPATPSFATATATDACGSTFTLTFNDVTTNGQCAGSYSVTRTWTATDACGNASTASQTINVTDTTAPVIAALPAPSTISCPATPSFATATATDACGSSFTLTFNDVTTNGQCAGSYSVTRTWTATDACGNASTASQTINVTDTTAPVIAALPAPSTISCPATPSFATATATDACGSTFTLTFNDVTTNGACAGSYSVTRTWTATDACGNASTASQTINVTDTTAPVIAALPAPSTISCPATPSFATATATDACGSTFTLTFNDVTTNGQCAGSYSVTRTWTATDSCGNASTASQTINVTDTTAPVIAALPAPSTISCPATPSFATATATDDCGSTFTLTFNDVTTNGQCAGSYSVTRTWTATDACGNASTASQTINVTDTTAPVIAALPAPSTISCPATPSFATATATDDCGSTFTLTFNDVTTNGACAGSYSVTRTWTATDACGNASTASQTINVTDTTAPVIAALPAPSTISCPATPSFATATATDACGSTFTLTFNDVTTNGQCAGSYSVTRTWTATDACGNASTASQTINVTDTTAPVITTQASNLIVECDGSGNQTAITNWLQTNGGAVANDLCSDVTWINNFNSLSNDCSTAVTVVFTATDACGNFISTSGTFTVQDITAPVVPVAPQPLQVSCASEVPTALPLTAIDNCSGNVTSQALDSIVPGQCPNSFIITRTWTFTDACNNSSNVSQTITVQDTTAPSFVEALPANVTVECSAVPTAQTLTATDNCGTATVAYNEVTTAGTCAGSYTLTRTWIATDLCGLTTTHVQTITVQDTTAPTFVEALPANVTVECSAVPTAQTLTATDNCGTATVAYNEVTTAGTCAGSYTLTRTWIATDLCGLTTTHVQTITVQDTTAPSFVEALPANVTVECSAVPTAQTLTATDNCGTATVAYNEVTTVGTCAGSYTLTRTWIATDLCGLTTTHVQTITVQDTTAPSFVEALPANVTVECSAVPTAQTLTATDNCGTATVAYNEVTTAGTCAGSYTLTRTWIATDLCGLTTTHVQTITVQDTTAPTFVEALPANVTVECSAVPTAQTLTATDNCGTATVAYNEVTTAGTCAGSYTLTRTWIATDLCGLTTTHVQTITVQDTTAPTFVEALPANVTVECSAVPTAQTLTATDNCGTATVAYNEVTTAGTCAGSYTLTRTWIATDLCGLTTTHVQTITVQDTTAPSFVEALPANVTVECSAVPTAQTLTATDNCGTATVAYNEVTTVGTCAGSYTLTRTWIATDLCGLTTTHVQTITVQDTTAPSFVEALPANVTVECSAVPTAQTLTATDNCGTATVAYNEVTTAGTCAGSYTLTRTWIATDLCGLTTTHVQTITVQDTTAPTFVEALPANVTVECSAVPTAQTLTATDNCGTATVAYNEVTTAGTCAGSYTLTRTWIATDLCGLTTTHVQTITVQDTTAPSFVEALPANVTVECSAVPTAQTLTATDNCGTATVAYNEVTTAGTCAGSYTLTRTWIATDLCGLTTTHVQTITVQDTTAPTFVEALPANVTVECSAVPTAQTLTATDNCGTATVAYNEVTTVGTCAGSYTLTRTWIATDLCGLTTTHVQTITVQDTTAPSFVEALPANVTVECSAVPTAQTLTATDNCGTATVAYNEVTTVGTCAGSYTLTRTWIATDLCGLTTTHVQTITVQDTTAPSFVEALPANVTVECSAVPTAQTLTATDNCGTATVAYNEVTTVGTCAGSYTLTRTWIATDLCGLTTTHVQTITVQDTTAPSFVEALPANVTVECSAVPTAVVLTATDNCGTATVAYNEVTTAGTCAGSYTLTRTWIATDLCGLTTTHVQTITVQDTTAPTFVEALPANVTVECSAVPIAVILTATDNCGTATVAYNEVTTAGTCAGSYTLTRTWIATDLCGLTTTHVQTITVQDTTAPTFVEALPANVTVECSAVPIAVILTATDNCGTATVAYNEVTTAGTCAGNYTLTRTWIATDLCGLTTTHVQTITVQDTTAPTVVTSFPTVLNVTCNSIPAVPQLVFTDACSSTPITVVTTETTSTVASDGTSTIVRTWTVTDACGNSDTFTQTINVSIPNYFQQLTIDTQCSLDIELEVNVMSIINTQFGTQPTGGTWTDVSSSGALDITNGVFTPLNLANGSYIVRYKTNDPDCPRTFEITIPTSDEFETCGVLACQNIVVYNAVTPNGDTMNDSFVIENINNLDCYPENTVEIFNRWGIKVFDTTNYDNRNRVFTGLSEGRGTVNQSAELPTGTYFYILKYKTSEGNYVTKNGYLYLSR